MGEAAAITLGLADVASLRLGKTGLETLRKLAGPTAKPLGQDRGSDFAFLALNDSASFAGTLKEVTREFVYLPSLATLISYDQAISADPPAAVSWTLAGTADTARLTSILPRKAQITRANNSLTVHPPKLSTDTGFLNVIHIAGPHAPGTIDSSDLAGVRILDRVAAFFTEPRMARSAVSFDVEGSGDLQFLIAGLAPGDWEIWRGGQRELTDGTVEPASGVLAFRGPAGSYFLRHT